MPIDLSKFKGKTLDDATLSEVIAAVTAHTDPIEAREAAALAKAKKAEDESINGRKALKAERDKAFDLLGITEAEELERVKPIKGQADEVATLQAQLKRAIKERDEAVTGRTEIEGKFTAERRARAIATEVAKHPFLDAEDVTALVGLRVKQDGDAFVFEGPDGKTSSLADGVAFIAKTKPHLVRPDGGGEGGSGFTGTKPPNGKKAEAPQRKDYPNEVEFFKAAAAFNATAET